ncbi:hypothetical protein N0V93_001459 [Gnomoniopsis smithogilvyi]|uniref:Cystathionine gamma-synthase n=1 Tax=Gnomoniopsis smithogilvyi TaxID=1191159 RepID=A0A9W9D2M4_9PEZI|nr:hypothetical protein N0V93_001459 [Gnomoniopsis smithogilvyi]
MPGWDTVIRFRDGDKSIFAKLRSLYPRFSPFGPARQLAAALVEKLGAVAGQSGLLMFLDPATFSAHEVYGLSDYRKENKLAEGDLTFKVVDVHGVRLYCVIYPLAKTPGTVGIWQNTGTGLSTRASEELVKFVDSEFAVVQWSGDVHDIPQPTYLPECEAHGALRKRIRDLLHRAPIAPEKVKVSEDDVFLYHTGMAAIYRANEALIKRDPGTILVLGSIFHNTWHLFEEAPGGMKHFGACTAASGVMDDLEQWAQAHYNEGKTISYAFVEFPSNPILVSVDLKRLRDIADKYSFPLLVDDTISSFANIDVLPVSDLLMSSLTKSFSGYADVMGGSVVLNPLSAFYTQLKPLFTSNFRNELFAGDAETLLANSANYLPRSFILNRNGAALSSYLFAQVANPESPIKAVLYPTTSDTRANYDAFIRPSTPDFTPGYGCLLSVDFHTLDAAIAFYDNFAAHNGPHLGAHRMLAIPFNTLVHGKVAEDAAYHASYGATPEQVRISVGLEDEEEVLAAARVALEAAARSFNGEKKPEGRNMQEALKRTEEPAKSKADVQIAAEGTSANFE